LSIDAIVFAKLVCQSVAILSVEPIEKIRPARAFRAFREQNYPAAVRASACRSIEGLVRLYEIDVVWLPAARSDDKIAFCIDRDRAFCSDRFASRPVRRLKIAAKNVGDRALVIYDRRDIEHVLDELCCLEKSFVNG